MALITILSNFKSINILFCLNFRLFFFFYLNTYTLAKTMIFINRNKTNILYITKQKLLINKHKIRSKCVYRNVVPLNSCELSSGKTSKIDKAKQICYTDRFHLDFVFLFWDEPYIFVLFIETNTIPDMHELYSHSIHSVAGVVV